MPICIACSTPVKNLYTTYSKADDRSLGKGVRLTQCTACKQFADRYVEYDFVLLFIDLVLIKPQVSPSTPKYQAGLTTCLRQVYRHLLFNRLGRADDKLDPSILRLGTLLVLFDVYITWARIEQLNASSDDHQHGPRWALSDAPILIQYLFFLTMNVLATVAQHGVIRFLSRVVFKQLGARRSDSHPRGASPSAISTALLVSSCSKLFPILLVIWPSANAESSRQDSAAIEGLGRAFVSNVSSYVGWVVLLNNIEALLILLDCGYAIATGLALTGLMCRWTVEGWALGLVGLRNSTSREAVTDGFSLVRSWLPSG